MPCTWATLSSVGRKALRCIFTLSQKQHEVRKKEKQWERKIHFLFSLQVLSEIFLILRKTVRDMMRYDVNCSIFLPYFNKTEFSRQICEIYLNIKFHENPINGSHVVTCGQTDGQT